MKFNIFTNTMVPIILTLLGICLIVLDHVNIQRKRKVTIQNHTKRSNSSSISKQILKSIASKLHKIDVYNSFLDRGQFIFGYFYEYSERQNRIEFEKFFFRRCIITGILSFCILFIQIENLMKILIIGTIIVLQILLVKRSVKKQQDRLEDEFNNVIREFIVGYELTHSVVNAFEYTMKEVQGVYRIHISRLINQLTSNTPPEEAFRSFSRRMNNDMCITFLDTVEGAYSSKESITTKLKKLQNMLNDERKEIKEQRNGIKKKGYNLFLWVIVLGIELVVEGIVFKTSTGNYFLTTEVGQYLLILSIIGIFIAIVLYDVSSSI